MKFYKTLLQRAGLGTRFTEITAAVFAAAFLVFATTYFWTKVFGFALSLGCLAVLFSLEAIRIYGNGRQEKLLKTYPALFDSMAQALSGGASLEQQIVYLSKSGPVDLRPQFLNFSRKLAAGEPLPKALAEFRERAANRFADLFCELTLIGQESGLAGQKENWKLLAQRTRSEQGNTALVLAKQDWVLGSAKVALLSPWLIAALLMQLPQNKEAFASEAGSAILILGLALSIFSYFLVNQLGTLQEQPRIFHEAS